MQFNQDHSNAHSSTALHPRRSGARLFGVLGRSAVLLAVLPVGVSSASAQGSFLVSFDHPAWGGRIWPAGGGFSGSTVSESKPDNNNSAGSAGTLRVNIGDDFAGDISAGTDQDFVGFHAAAGQSILAETVMGYALVDTELTLYDVDGVSQLAHNDDSYVNGDDGPEDVKSLIEYTFTASGTYFLKVGFQCGAECPDRPDRSDPEPEPVERALQGRCAGSGRGNAAVLPHRCVRQLHRLGDLPLGHTVRNGLLWPVLDPGSQRSPGLDC